MPLQATSGAASYDGFGGGVAAVPNYIEECFSTTLYTGNGSTQTITNGIDLSTKGVMVWLKARDNPFNNELSDTVRGSGKYLISNSTASQYTSSTHLNAFTSSGFTVGSDSSVNASTGLMASWTFREQPKFFDVVTYTGNGSAKTISHNLGSTPGCIIVKRTASSSGWYVYHRSLAANNSMELQSTDAAGLTYNFASVTSTSFNVTSATDTNENNQTYVAYLFAHNAGGFGLTGTDNVISCGSFTDTTTVNLGYEPQWVLFKKSSSSSIGDWFIADNMRGFSETSINTLSANTSSAEASYTSTGCVLTSTGFTYNTGLAGSGTFIYIAIRRGPMKVPTDATKVFAPVAYTGDGSSTRDLTFGFPVDMFINNYRGVSAQRYTRDRLRGGTVYLSTPSTDAEATSSSYNVRFDSNTGIDDIPPAWDNASGFTFVDYGFRRAPSFFDEVCYTGTGSSATSFSHNLGVAPELIISKVRSASGSNWIVTSNFTSTNYLLTAVNLTIAGSTFNYTDDASIAAQPTSTTLKFTGGVPAVNDSGSTYVAYLFATCAGVSKVGSYTGDGTVGRVIDCGFTSGARFVMFKRTSTTSDWYVYDTARGIVAGDEKSLSLNTTAAESGSGDFIDLDNSGFVVGTAATDYFNESGVSFIFLAIA